MNPLLRSILCTNSIVHQLGKRTISTSDKLCTMWEKDDRGGYPMKPLPPFKERMRIGLAELKKEIKIWGQELKETWEGDPILIWRPGETDIAWRFKSQDSLDKWIISSDSDNNQGYSHCSLTRNAYGNAVFSGNINLRVPKDGKVKRAGFCSIQSVQARKSFKRESYYDWSPYNTLIMKIRGDGRTYLLNISSRGFYDIMWNDMFHYQLYTRGGPYWQVCKIPFSKFFFASKGRIQDIQCPLRLDRVSSFGISAQDRHGGDFSLEIDYIGLESDPRHVEEFAYEQYQIESGIVNV